MGRGLRAPATQARNECASQFGCQDHVTPSNLTYRGREFVRRRFERQTPTEAAIEPGHRLLGCPALRQRQDWSFWSTTVEAYDRSEFVAIIADQQDDVPQARFVRKADRVEGCFAPDCLEPRQTGDQCEKRVGQQSVDSDDDDVHTSARTSSMLVRVEPRRVARSIFEHRAHQSLTPIQSRILV